MYNVKNHLIIQKIYSKNCIKFQDGSGVNGHRNINVTRNNSEDNRNGKTSNEAYFSAIIIAFVRLLSSLLISQLLRKYRRRTMYVISLITTITSLTAFATCDLLIEYFLCVQIYFQTHSMHYLHPCQLCPRRMSSSIHEARETMPPQTQASLDSCLAQQMFPA